MSDVMHFYGNNCDKRSSKIWNIMSVLSDSLPFAVFFPYKVGFTAQ